MKNTFLLVFLFACAVLPYLAKAQGSINASPDGDACPNKDYTYTYTGSAIGCSWVVKGSYSIISQNASVITVRWKDVPTDASANPTAVQMNCGANNTTTRAVFVSSISPVTPGPLTVNGTPVGAQFALPFGDNAPLSLKVPLVELPQSSTNNVFLAAITYEWVIPAGWRYNDGTNYVSDGTTPHRVSGSPQAGNQLAVTPAPGTDGTISVRAINDRCINNSAAGPDNSVSKTLSVNITRPTPTLTLVSDKTPNGGNFNLNCGDQSDYHFRVVVGPIPSGGSFSNQSFQVSAPLTATGPLTGSYAVSTAFSGATGVAGILFQARYTRNGASVDVHTDARINVQSSLAPISFISLPTHLCNGESATLRANQVVGASQYTWTLPGILTTTATPTTPGGHDYVTTTPQLPITVGGNAYLYNYRVAVQVAAGSASCGSSSTTGTFVVGLAEQINVASSSQVSPQSPYQICANQPVQFSVTLDGQQGDVTGYDWVVNDAPYGPGNGTPTINLYSPPAGQTLHVIATVHSPCGDLTRGVYVSSTSSIDGQPCEQSFTGPAQPAEQLAAYPNPADKDLTLEQGGGTVRLSDAYGKPVRSQAARPGLLHLDTSRLPAGLYFLEMRDGKGQPVRKQIHVRHQ